MRIYLSSTLTRLAAAVAAEAFGPVADAALVAHAVTPTVREWYVEGDEEELEYAVLLEAARTSLRLLAEDNGCPPRRVVVAADVPDRAVRPAPGLGRSRVQLTGSIPLTAVASVHVDEPEAEPAVAAAVEALPAADVGDDDALFALDEAQACDLLWYDVSEISHLSGGC
jgi:hypothetical protein